MVFGLTGITTQLQRTLDMQAQEITAHRMKEITDSVKQGHVDAASATAANHAAMQLAWQTFSTKHAEDKHSASLLRLETMYGETNKSLQARAHALGMMDVIIDGRFSPQPDGRPPPPQFDQDRRRRSQRSQPQFNWDRRRQSDSDPDDREPKRARGEGGRVQRNPLPGVAPGRRPMPDPLAKESDANWERWSPAEMQAWMVHIGADALGAILFPPLTAEVVPQITLKHGSQMENITAAVLASIGDPDNVTLNFAKTTFAKRFAKLLKKNPSV